VRRYLLRHLTSYHYSLPVTVSHNVAHLHPREESTQQVRAFNLSISPQPLTVEVRRDAWGNRVDAFVIQEPHLALEVAAGCTVTVDPHRPPQPGDTPAWSTIASAILPMEVAEFRFDSPLIPCAPALRAFAREVVAPDATILAAGLALNQAVFRRFIYDPRATTVETPVLKALDLRRGVCQDFAGVLIGCLRSLGLPARYISGYLETSPPAGQQRLVGADASHAWAQVWCGAQTGWIDLDPTNNCIPGERHITAARGRDFGDVSPLKGMVLGGGNAEVRVAVDVIPDDEPTHFQAQQQQQ
jgi:transglutaminase-like putative cysteine protease